MINRESEKGGGVGRGEGRWGRLSKRKCVSRCLKDYLSKKRFVLNICIQISRVSSFVLLDSFLFCLLYLPSASCISSRTELIANRCHLFLLFSRIFFDVCESEEERILKLCPT